MKRPIVIHSLFRSGSTYIFDRFRRAPGGYWCYQEPLNEFLLNAMCDPERLLEAHKDKATELRHPALERPYFYEFYGIAKEIAETFRREFSYEDYFPHPQDSSEALRRYLRVLVDGAQGKPILQECRSCGRVNIMREAIDGLHIFLWRNPWDQWWSYKVDSHFEVCNLQILAARFVPPVFAALREQLNFFPASSEVEQLITCRLNAAESYMLFFSLWCHALLEARRFCDFDINIDSLSQSAQYRQTIKEKMQEHGIDDLDFSDCKIPIDVYGTDDRRFFAQLEERVTMLFTSSGYRIEDMELMQRVRQLHDVHGPRPDLADDDAKRHDRLRHTARRLESELADAQRIVGNNRRQFSVELHAQQQTYEDILGVMDRERQDLQRDNDKKKLENEQLEHALLEKTVELDRILSSRSWRMTAPVRALGKAAGRIIKVFWGRTDEII